ncbi:MAG TPA: M23 family metallopeptidase [Clostridia bacterium]|nr:M23 family metallopeptidase [Clostridia bacterium]
MKHRAKIEMLAIVVLAFAVLGSCLMLGERTVSTSANTSSGVTGSTIKWVSFNIPYSALNRALQTDISSHTSGKQVHWVELLAYLGTKYGGNWKLYRAKDLDDVAIRLKNGENIQSIAAGMKNYDYFYKAYDAVLGNFVGDYEIQVPDPNNSGSKVFKITYGLKVFSPIAAGYGYGHYDDFGDSRSFGFRRKHLGNDLMGTVGTPIVAVEGGYVESAAWNRYGGWRIGIRSFDKKRYYYYAHLRKDHPFYKNLKQGDIVNSGDVIGYLGMTGYSDKENINNMKKPHLHFGMQLIFDESQKDGNNEIWIDVYNIVNLLARNRVSVQYSPATKDYSRLYDFFDLKYHLYFD